MPLGISFELTAYGMDRCFLTNAGQDILQWAAAGMVIEDVIGRDEWNSRRIRQSLQTLYPPGIVTLIQEVRRQPDGAIAMQAETVEDFKSFAGLKTMRQHYYQKLTLGKIQQIRQRQKAFAFFDARCRIIRIDAATVRG